MVKRTSQQKHKKLASMFFDRWHIMLHKYAYEDKPFNATVQDWP
ncbi:predicted protein [Botrytis cinerea T4]|uniref:Uncharacterized protein n=1 Tax=Botryotinia fuckeliana (strain T4) TaxID=999810 RepID=G2YFL7_BOTF4|nr:predicted protein [Botrytis cinerea T4]